MALQLVTEAQLDTLGDGLYQVGDKGKKGLTPRRQTGTVFDLAENAMVTGLMVLFARVKPAGEAPKGVERVTIRPDGKMVILAWALERQAEKNVGLI